MSSNVSPLIFRTVWFVVIGLCFGGVFFLYNTYRSQGMVSADIFEKQNTDEFSLISTIESSPDQMGRGLKANLDEVKMIVPMRPHNPDDLRNPEKKQNFTRRGEFTISTDDWGFRKSSISKKKDATNKKIRVLCLGDSKTFGWGVEYHQSYVYYLEREMKIDVINASMPGAIPIDAALSAEKYIQQFQPSVIIFHFRPTYDAHNSVDNFLEAIHHLQMKIGGSKLLLVLPPISTFETAFDEIEQYYQSKDFSSLEQEELQRKLPNIPVLDVTSIFRKKQKRYSSRNETLVMFKQEEGYQYLTTPLGETITKVTSPNKPFFSFFPFAPPSVFSDELLQPFEEDSTMREPYFLDGAHLDSEGNRLFAQTVAEQLKKSLRRQNR